MDESELRVYVTDADIGAARVAWVRAVHGEASDERVTMLRHDLEQLWRAQAQQIIAEFWCEFRASALLADEEQCAGDDEEVGRSPAQGDGGVKGADV